MKQAFLLWVFLLLGYAVSAQALSNDTLHWAEYRKITWTDFKGDPIDVQGLSGQSLMMILANYKKHSLFSPTEAIVITVFDKKNSWTTTQNQTALGLEYYQVMFDIYEDYSRRLRKEFKHTRFGIDPNKMFQEKYSTALTALSDRTKQYMKETKLGTDSAAVYGWHGTIKRELDSLVDYARK